VTAILSVLHICIHQKAFVLSRQASGSNALELQYRTCLSSLSVRTGAFGDMIVSSHPTPADTRQSRDISNGGDEYAEGSEDEDEDDQNGDEPRGTGTESSSSSSSSSGGSGRIANSDSSDDEAAAGLEVDTAARRVKRRAGTGRWAQPQPQPQPRMVLFALRDIQEGEELFLDYGSEYWRGRPTARFAPASESAAAVAPPTAASAADGNVIVNSGQGAAANSKRQRRRSPTPQS
jgi:hypothetical protein